MRNERRRDDVVDAVVVVVDVVAAAVGVAVAVVVAEVDSKSINTFAMTSQNVVLCGSHDTSPGTYTSHSRHS